MSPRITGTDSETDLKRRRVRSIFTDASLKPCPSRMNFQGLHALSSGSEIELSKVPVHLRPIKTNTDHAYVGTIALALIENHDKLPCRNTVGSCLVPCF